LGGDEEQATVGQRLTQRYLVLPRTGETARECHLFVEEGTERSVEAAGVPIPIQGGADGQSAVQEDQVGQASALVGRCRSAQIGHLLLQAGQVVEVGPLDVG
jgi:hypothetical protein